MFSIYAIYKSVKRAMSLHGIILFYSILSVENSIRYKNNSRDIFGNYLSLTGGAVRPV